MQLSRRLFLIALLIGIEVQFVPIPLAFIALFMLLFFYDEEQALTLACIAGFFFDVLLVKPLGSTSLFLLVLLFVTVLYKKKYAHDNLFFLAFALIVNILILEFVLYGRIALTQSITSSVLVMVLARLFFATPKYESWYRIS